MYKIIWTTVITVGVFLILYTLACFYIRSRSSISYAATGHLMPTFRVVQDNYMFSRELVCAFVIPFAWLDYKITKTEWKYWDNEGGRFVDFP